MNVCLSPIQSSQIFVHISRRGQIYSILKTLWIRDEIRACVIGRVRWITPSIFTARKSARLTKQTDVQASYREVIRFLKSRWNALNEYMFSLLGMRSDPSRSTTEMKMECLERGWSDSDVYMRRGISQLRGCLGSNRQDCWAQQVKVIAGFPTPRWIWNDANTVL
jgi:hypothetical protein